MRRTWDREAGDDRLRRGGLVLLAVVLVLGVAAAIKVQKGAQAEPSVELRVEDEIRIPPGTMFVPPADVEIVEVRAGLDPGAVAVVRRVR